jgi:uncharacterized Zn finger protein (UPF0148 family)
MFDETLREIENLKHGLRVSLTLPMDEKGYFDRRCPSELCKASFKVLFEDWKNLVRDEVVFCPICRHEAIASEWNTEEQNEYLTKFSLEHISRVIGNSLSQDAQSFNRQQPKDGFITMSMSFKPGISPVVLPIEAAEAMEQCFICESCGCRYASAGAAFFCPSCGYNSATTTFDNAIQTTLKMISTLPEINESISKSFNNDAAKDIERQIIENSFCRIISSFERFAEATFTRLPKATEFTLRKNVFQNLNESSKLWHQATGKSYEAMILKDELTNLNRFFQQRHLITHKESIVDQEYIIKTNDNTYSVGQRLIIREETVRQLADLIVKLANQLKKLI